MPSLYLTSTLTSLTIAPGGNFNQGRNFSEKTNGTSQHTWHSREAAEIRFPGAGYRSLQTLPRRSLSLRGAAVARALPNVEMSLSPFFWSHRGATPDLNANQDSGTMPGLRTVSNDHVTVPTPPTITSASSTLFVAGPGRDLYGYGHGFPARP